MDKYKIELGIRAIRELERQRNKLCSDIETGIVKINTYNEEITELTEILNTELLANER